MAARAIWKGVITFDDVRVPVKLYSAVQDRSIRFHLLHDQDMVRIRQRMAQPKTNKTVPPEEIHKGYEVERGLFVMLEPEELASLEPPESREIEITRFVEPAAINHQWYIRPYWLGPDGNDADYFALTAALSNRNREGVARWVMRKQRYVGALRAEGDYLMLITLRHAGEVIPSSDLEPPSGRELDTKEQKLAQQLVGALEGEFDPHQYRDEYGHRVRELIETKRRGGTVEFEEHEEAPQRESLAESLRASLQRAGSR